MHAPTPHTRKSLLGLLFLSAPLPALVVGVLVMQQSRVSSGVWVQQLAAGLTLAAICGALSFSPRLGRPLGFPTRPVLAVGALLLLAVTLAQPGLEGVRRWVSLGPLHLHAAFLALPILIMVIGSFLSAGPSRAWAWAFPLATTVVALVLMLQPDPSQASAFGVALVVLLFVRASRTRRLWLSAGIILLAATVAWTRPDPLAPVPHVEDIVGLAGDLGVGWVAGALVALLLLPIPFIAAALSDPHRDRTGLAVAIYFAIVSIMPALGPYPVPILGFGLAPMLGYFAALGWVIVKSRAPNPPCAPPGLPPSSSPRALKKAKRATRAGSH